jgi:hypothetical protein
MMTSLSAAAGMALSFLDGDSSALVGAFSDDFLLLEGLSAFLPSGVTSVAAVAAAG